MNAAVPLSDDEWRAAEKALHYVKEVLADMALSSIRESRGGGGGGDVTLQKEEPLFIPADRPGEGSCSVFGLYCRCWRAGGDVAEETQVDKALVIHSLPNV